MAQNYLLPKTEQSINRLLDDMHTLVQGLMIALYTVFFVYSAYRLAFNHTAPVLNGIYLFITAISIGFCIVELTHSNAVSPSLRAVLKVTRRLVRLVILMDAMWTVFSQVQGFRAAGMEIAFDTGISIVYALFSIILYVLVVVGDAVSSLCQRYINDLLKSFTEDIQLEGLTSRGISQVQQAARKKITTIIPGLRDDRHN